MCTRARTQLLRNRPAEALRSIEMAARRILRAEDRPMLLYTAYRANMQAGNYREAARQIDRFICLNDSLTRTALQSSADMIEKEYFRERAAFYDYRLEHRRKRELAVIGAGILLLGIAGAVLGVLMIFDPFKGAKALMIFTGISLLVTGVESIYAIVCISRVFRSSGHQQIIDATWHDV